MADAELTKVCARCRAEKPHNAFYWSNAKNAPRSRCRSCMAEERAAQSGRLAAKSAAWRAADPERHKASLRSSRLKHLEKRRAAQRERWASDHQRAAANTERVRLYRQADPENNNNAQARARRSANPERHRDYHRAYHETKPDKRKVYTARRRAAKASAGGSHTDQDVRDIRQMQKDRCAVCRIDLKRRGQLDHITPLARGGSDDRRNLQLLCKACNCRKQALDPIDFMRRRGLLL